MRIPIVLAALAACGTAAVAAEITYTFTGTVSANAGDSAGINGAFVTFAAKYDDSGVYLLRFGLPAVAAKTGVDAPTFLFAGSANGTNDGTASFTTDLAFYPTFAGTFTEPGGLHTNIFTLGSGVLMEWRGNTSASAGSGNAVIGGAIQLDDFAPANYTGGGFSNLSNGESYTLGGWGITATMTVIPLPSASALAGLGLLGIGTRRRRASL